MSNTTPKDCKIEDCRFISKTFRRGLCASHYNIFLAENEVVRNKDRLVPRPAIIEGDIAKIPLGVNAKDGYAIVDKEFAYLADEYKWSLDNYGYALTGKSPKRHKLHHMIIGKPKKGMVMDHINQNKLDNRVGNLRKTTYSENSINQPLSSKNKSGYKNIYWAKREKKWSVQICRNSKTKTVGAYADINEAILARDRYMSQVV